MIIPLRYRQLRQIALSAFWLGLAAVSASGQTVSGIVREADNGPALRSMVVAAYNPAGFLQANTTTDSVGHYDLALPAGQYRVLAYDPAGTYATQFANDAPSFEESPLVTLGNAQVVTMNFTLRRGVAISGTVLTAGGPRGGLTVAAYNLSGTRRGFATTNGSGNYTLILPSGTYKIAAYDDTGVFAPAFFRDQSDFTSANVVTVSSGGPQASIDFFLPLAAHASGIVTDATGTPVGNISVLLYTSAGKYLGLTTTAADGRFSFTLQPGSYRFIALDPAFRFAAAYPGDANSFQSSPAVVLNSGQTKGDLTFRMNRGGLVEGSVIDASTGAPLRDIVVAAYNSDGSQRTFVTTDANGHYALLLPAGSFRIAAFDTTLASATQFYPNQMSFARATSISPIAGSSITLQPFALTRGGRVSGTVTDQFTHVPIAGAIVQAFDGNGRLVGETIAADGAYRLVLPPGTYRLVAADPQLRYAPGYSGGTSNFDTATSVTVSASSETFVDFTLRRGTRVIGTVVDESHQPVPDVEVSALDVNQNRVASAKTGADGTFQFAVAPDTYKFIAVDAAGRYGVAYFGGSTFTEATAVNVDATGAPHVTVVVSGPNRRRGVGR